MYGCYLLRLVTVTVTVNSPRQRRERRNSTFVPSDFTEFCPLDIQKEAMQLT